MKEDRLSPEKLLKQISDEEKQAKRGKLKIYFGAAPGVGKTYSMLQDATSKLAKGLDVVVGVAESHGRSEIDALLKNFEIIPRQSVEYRDRTILEFDLDGTLRRNPALVLIDEMAHTNVPGLRHSKRWQDIKEIIDRGIDVYTTLNVQHIESINDDVAQIIGSKVRETVPDSMIEIADTIELVDLPAQDLLKRLQEGKVYFPTQAELAKENFFRTDKLTALRELALRITAERVGEQVLSYRQGEGVQAIWPSKEKIMVCVGPGAASLKLIRTAKRVATLSKIDWIAVHIDAPRLRMTEDDRKAAINNLKLAEQLGAETRTIVGTDVVKEIMEFAREQNITQIIVGKKIRPRWKNILRQDLADEIVRQSGEIDVYVVTGSVLPGADRKKRKIDETNWLPYVYATMIVIFATVFDLALFPTWAPTNIVMVYFLGIIIVALFGRLGPSILASILSVISYGIFFIGPSYEFMASDIQYFFTLLVMLLIAQIISSLTILTRRQAESSFYAEHQTNILHRLSRRLASTRGVDNILDIGSKYIAEVFHCDVLALQSKEVHDQRDGRLTEKEYSVVQWVYELGQKAGKGTDTLSFSDSLYLPLIASKNVRGVLRIKPKKQDDIFSPEEMRLLESCANQIALAIEANRVDERHRKTELQAAIDQVQNQMLQDISHDLRSPLLTAMGALTTIFEDKKKIKMEDVQSLCRDSYYELEKLNRLINNFLQISYLENKNIKLEKIPMLLKEIIDIAVSSMSLELSERILYVNVPTELPKVFVDSSLIIEVIRHLLENAIKFSPLDSSIEISAHREEKLVVVCVKDQGPGVDTNEKEKLFEKFYRGREITTERGLGLGLAICQKIVAAHGGHIWAENLAVGGASFCFTLHIDEIDRP